MSGQGKKKRPAAARAGAKPGPSPRKGGPAADLSWKAGEDDEITSEEEDSGRDEGGPASKKRAGEGLAPPSDDESSEEETAEDKRMRLAKEYIFKIRGEAGAEGGDEEVGERLRQDVMAAQGTLFTPIAAQLAGVTIAADAVRAYRGHKVCMRHHCVCGHWRRPHSPLPRVFLCVRETHI